MLEQYQVKPISKVLTEDQCQYCIESIENTKPEEVIEGKSHRKLYSFSREKETYKQIFEICDKITKTTINPDLESRELFIVEYKPGYRVTKHKDRGIGEKTVTRAYTLVIQLSPESHYTGGKTLIYNNGSTFELNQIRGSGIIFDSGLEHEVTTIETGNRFSLAILYHKTIKKVVI